MIYPQRYGGLLKVTYVSDQHDGSNLVDAFLETGIRIATIDRVDPSVNPNEQRCRITLTGGSVLSVVATLDQLLTACEDLPVSQQQVA